ncbi:MAG: hypothetical protein L6R40_001657 [Gallowayella cf. fulva]|nr:MAG: hypothetical protein L6R40_001657 [Xanthomendoza cf. fulva]
MTTYTDLDVKTEGTVVAKRVSSSIKDKTILVTGVGPNGLGETLCLLLAGQQPARLIITGLSHEKDEGATDILINNAGVMNVPERQLDTSLVPFHTDRYEMHLAINHLGPFAFTHLILPKILASHKSPRIVNVVSNGYGLSPFRFSDWNFDGTDAIPEKEQPPQDSCKTFGVFRGLGYIPPVAYGQSKTAGTLFTKELAKRLEGKVTVTCLNPGATDTDLWRQMPRETVQQGFASMPPKSMMQGASTPLVATLNPKLEGTHQKRKVLRGPTKNKVITRYKPNFQLAQSVLATHAPNLRETLKPLQLP